MRGFVKYGKTNRSVVVFFCQQRFFLNAAIPSNLMIPVPELFLFDYYD